MGECYITRRGNNNNNNGSTKQLGIYPIDEYGKPTGDVVVPEGVTNLSVPFNNNKNIVSVSLQNGIKSLPSSCFENCNNLQTINIPNTLSTIYSNCFKNCASLQNVLIEKRAEGDKISCEPYAFSGCSSLNDSNVENILQYFDAGYYMFQNCRGLNHINLSNIKASEGMFYNCTNLLSAKIGTDTLGNACFRGCTSLKDVTIPDTVISMVGNCFRGCTSLQNITIPESVTAIGDRCFFQCSSLQNITIPKNVTSIGSRCFAQCTSLENVVISEGVTATSLSDSIFNSCTSLKTVYLPSSINTETVYLTTSTIFYECSALEDIRLGQDWCVSLRLDMSTRITVDSIVAMFNSLKDLTGDTAKTLTLGTTNLDKLTDEQKQIAINKNWTLA